jgi:hypothetical protein
MADAGLSRGKLGAGKKLKPDSIRQYKGIWQKKIRLEAQHRRETIPLRAKNQLEILYKFEIHKSKNFILSLQDRDKRIRETFDYFDQLVIEEFISGINIRAILLDAYSDLAVQTIDATTLPKRLSKSLWGLLLHLVGPDMVHITVKDRKILLECLRIFETLGEFAGEFGGGIPVLKAVCKEIYGFAEITSWYRLESERKHVLSVFRKIHIACASFGPPGATRSAKREINDRQAVVRKYWNIAKKLS